MSTQTTKKRMTNAAVTSYRVACGNLGFMKKGINFVATPPKETEGYKHVYTMQKHLEKESWNMACKSIGADAGSKERRMKLEAKLKVIKDEIKIPTRTQVALLRTWEKEGVPERLELFSIGQKKEIRRKSAIESKPIIDARRLVRKKKKEAKKAREKAEKEEKIRVKQEKLDARRAKLKEKREEERAAKIASGEIVPKVTSPAKKRVAKKATKATKKAKKSKTKKLKKSKKAVDMQVEGQVAISA